MAWSNSKIFSACVTDCMNNATAFNLATDSIKAALFNNSVVPSQTVTSANSAYNAGVWNANEVTDATGWPAGGRALGTLSSTFTSNVYTFTAANTVSGAIAAAITAAYGCLVYDLTAATVANQGICYNYFGGSNTATVGGTFTIAWNASGIFTLTL